jgi:hypothetical protein
MRQAGYSANSATTTTSFSGSTSRILEGAEFDSVQPSVLSWRNLAQDATPVMALDRPVPGIARCVTGPVPLRWLPAADRPARHPSRRAHCLAVDGAGNLAAPDAAFTGDAALDRRGRQPGADPLHRAQPAARASRRSGGRRRLGAPCVAAGARHTRPAVARLPRCADAARSTAAAAATVRLVAVGSAGRTGPRRAQTIDPHDLNARTVAIDAMLAGTQRLALGRTVDRARDHGWQGLFVDGDSAEELARLLCRLNHEASGEGPLAALRQVSETTGDVTTGTCGGNPASRLVSALGRGSAEEFGTLWLELLPPARPTRFGSHTLRLLRSVHEVLRIGRALRNCVKHSDMVLT